MEFAKAMSTYRKKPTKKKLPTKKNVVGKASPLPLPKDGGSADGSLTNKMAEIMIAMTKYSPSKSHKMCSSLTKNDNRAVAPSLPDLLVKKDSPNEASIRAVSNGNSTLNSSQEILPVIFLNAPNEIEWRLIMLRVRELERQLAGERLWSRIQELEDEMSKRDARERLLRSVLDTIISQDRSKSTAVAPVSSNRSFMHDGLWGLVSASMIHPSVQASERANMLSRIVELHHAVMHSKCPSSTVSRNNSPEILEGRPSTNNRQRLG